MAARIGGSLSETAPVVVLAGGVGAARFLEGVVQVVAPAEVVAIVNVGDDLEVGGLHVSPDLDTVTYTLAGRVNPETGWGLRGDSFVALAALEELGGPGWFRLGDRDLATHLFRTHCLREGASLSAVTAEITRTLGVEVRVIPVTDQRLRTMVETPEGEVSFQEYFVRRRSEDRVLGLRLAGLAEARAAPGVFQAILHARAIVIAPSNPFLSIEPVLAVTGVRDCLLTSAAPKAAISPIIGGEAVKGPAAAILESLGHDVSALGVARLYSDLIDLFVLDERDAALADAVRTEVGAECLATQTIMSGAAEKRALARVTLEALQALQAS